MLIHTVTQPRKVQSQTLTQTHAVAQAEPGGGQITGRFVCRSSSGLFCQLSLKGLLPHFRSSLIGSFNTTLLTLNCLGLGIISEDNFVCFYSDYELVLLLRSQRVILFSLPPNF